jgi:hypothetical protein
LVRSNFALAMVLESSLVAVVPENAIR